MASRHLASSQSLIVAMILLAMALAGCNSERPPASASIGASEMASPSADPELGLLIELLDGKFSAEQIEQGDEPTLNIPVGTKVTFINREDRPHTATHGLDGEPADYPLFDLALAPGEQRSFIFTDIGDYPVTCIRHGDMSLSIIVNEQ